MLSQLSYAPKTPFSNAFSLALSATSYIILYFQIKSTLFPIFFDFSSTIRRSSSLEIRYFRLQNWQPASAKPPLVGKRRNLRYFGKEVTARTTRSPAITNVGHLPLLRISHSKALQRLARHFLDRKPLGQHGGYRLQQADILLQPCDRLFPGRTAAVLKDRRRAMPPLAFIAKHSQGRRPWNLFAGGVIACNVLRNLPAGQESVPYRASSGTVIAHHIKGCRFSNHLRLHSAFRWDNFLPGHEDLPHSLYSIRCCRLPPPWSRLDHLR